MTKDAATDDIAGIDAAAMVRGFTQGHFDPVDVFDATASKIDRLDTDLNAFVSRNSSARDAAIESAARYRLKAPLGPLDGVPVALKDNLVAAGLPATWGSRVFADQSCEADELPVAKLRSAGAVIVGKTNTPEFAVEGYTGNALFGVTRNPWNPRLTPGGSSGGSAAAVAARMVPIALGTDGGGSIHRPAAYTGLVGLKPTIGRIARHGGLPQVLLDFEVVGLLTHTIADARATLQVLSGAERSDPSSRYFARLEAASALAQRPLRILYVESFGDAPCDPSIRQSARLAAATLSELRHTVTESELPLPITRLGEMWSSIGAIGLARLRAERPAMESMAGPKYLEMADRGASLGSVQFASILEEISKLRRLASQVFAEIDVIMTPSCAAMPWLAEDTHPDAIAGVPVGPRGHAIYTGWVNAIGHPAIALPSRPSDDGTPIGIQLVGDLGAEQLLLDLGTQFEQAQPWTRAIPL